LGQDAITETRMQILQGTWEDIRERESELAGERVTVIVIDDRDPSDPQLQDSTRRARNFLAWAESHRRDVPPASHEAISRESIYGDRGL
jgi:hypothetical protein